MSGVCTDLSLPAAIAFDLDGTLLETVPDLAAAADAMLAELGRPAAGEDRVRRYVGNGIERLVHRLLTGEMDADAEPAQLAHALPLFKACYARSNGSSSHAYEGVADGLLALRRRGLPLACVTNKAAAFSEPLLAAQGLAQYFDVIVSGDSLAQRKPHPLPFEHTARHFGCIPAALLVVGDSSNDVRAARAAGCPVVCVPYGYNHGRDIGDESPDAVINSIADLDRLLPEAAGTTQA